MPHETSQYAGLIVYASPDKEKALHIQRSLEARGLLCALASLDTIATEQSTRYFIAQLNVSLCIIPILSTAANDCRYFRFAISKSVALGKPVYPFRVEDMIPSPDLEFFISTTQWIEAWPEISPSHVETLYTSVAHHQDNPRSGEPKAHLHKRHTRWPVRTASVIVLTFVAVSAANWWSPNITYIGNTGTPIRDINASDIRLEAIPYLGAYRVYIRFGPGITDKYSIEESLYSLDEGEFQKASRSRYFGVSRKNQLDSVKLKLKLRSGEVIGPLGPYNARVLPGSFDREG
ncbi:toll/interleukin-1 receptor domain-containing protein [Ectothiorhodospiraceae bacterium WFHF3C12]|nr:toll/interleukin-1 receptor domain-containing protein [Ectothiorhodospiraceae bacterium WFHF3C12]